MSSIQHVLNSVDLRRKIFNLKTYEKKKDMYCIIQNNRYSLICELNVYIRELKNEFENYEYPLEFTQKNFVNEFFDWVYNDVIAHKLKYIRSNTSRIQVLDWSKIKL
jgi:hypothetical protein